MKKLRIKKQVNKKIIIRQIRYVVRVKEKKEMFGRCLAEKMLTYGLGRGLEYYDKCAVDKIVAALARNDYRFSTLLLEVVQSEPFQMRTAVGRKE